MSKVSALHVARLGLNDGAQLWISFKHYTKNSYPESKVRQKLQKFNAEYGPILRILILNQK